MYKSLAWRRCEERGFNYLNVENRYVLPDYPVISNDQGIEEIPVKIFERAFEKLFDGVFIK